MLTHIKETLMVLGTVVYSGLIVAGLCGGIAAVDHFLSVLLHP